jgi:toxin FitB
MRVLCDTNILSELARPRPDAGVVAWARGTTRIALSVVTLEEVRFGLTWKPNTRVLKWFDAFLNDFCDIIPITAEIAACAGNLRGGFRSLGDSRTQADMLIAATAMLHRFTLVTRNTADFENCNIQVLNPFS